MIETSVITIQPATNLVGSIRVPGDKSISHRYAMLAGIAEGQTRLTNFSTGADCASTVQCMADLGCTVNKQDGVIEIEGLGLTLREPKRPLDCGNSGSTMRMLAGILAGQPFASTMFGDESLSRRPMKRVIDPLTSMGAKIESSAEGRPPLKIQGGKLKAIDYVLPVASAQVKSAVLLAGLFTDGETWVQEPLRTRDHTEVAIRSFGGEIKKAGNKVGIPGGQKLHGIDAHVPGDISSAAFFLCAAALFPDSNLVIDTLLLNPTRAVLLDVLNAMGAKVKVLNLEEHHGELVGTVSVEPGQLKGIKLSGAQTAALIDEVPILAAIAPYTQKGIEIRDAKELRVKETDRIAALCVNLRAMGAEVQELEDGLVVPGDQKLRGAQIDSMGDHRIAMAFAVAALRASGPSEIHGAEAARISFPEFFTLLQQLTSN